MTALWLGALVFLILFFAMMAINRGRGYQQPQPPVYQPPAYQQPPPVYQPQPYYNAQQPNRYGCQRVVVLLFVVLILFVGSVIALSIAAQAWIPF